MAPQRKRPASSATGFQTPPRRTRRERSPEAVPTAPVAPVAAPADQSAAPPAAEAPVAALAGQSAAPDAVEIDENWSDDEKFAARGLSLKVFAHQIPDLWSLVVTVQECVLAYHARPDAEIAAGAPLHVFVSRVCVILRIARGASGIPWVKRFLVGPLLDDLCSTHPTSVVLQNVGLFLVREWNATVQNSQGAIVQYVSSWELVNQSLGVPL